MQRGLSLMRLWPRSAPLLALSLPLPSPRGPCTMAGDIDRHTVRLTHPDGGGDVVVLGTAHISAEAASEAGALIRSLRPEVVVIELDAERFAALQKSRAHGRTHAAAVALAKGDSVSKLLGLAWSGELPGFAGSVGYALAGTLLDAEPGGEFAEAVVRARRRFACDTTRTR